MQITKIEKRIYKIFYKGKTFSLPLHISTGVSQRQKVLVSKKLRKFS